MDSLMQRISLLLLIFCISPLVNSNSLTVEAEQGNLQGPIEIRDNPSRIRTMAWDADTQNSTCSVGCVVYSIEVPESGEYTLELLTRADVAANSTSKGNGFTLSFGQYNNIKWTWMDSPDWRWVKFFSTISLIEGNNDLVLDLYRPNVEVDKIRLSLLNHENNGNITLSAINASHLLVPMLIGSDDSVPQQTVLYATNSEGRDLGYQAGGEARFRVLIQRPGTYKLKALVKSVDPEPSHDSFYVSIGHLLNTVWHLNLETEKYTWQEFYQTVRLTPGYHDLVISGRDSHTYIKKLRLEWLESSEDMYVFEAEDTYYLKSGMSAIDNLGSIGNEHILASSTGSQSYYKVFFEELGNYDLYVFARSSGSQGIVKTLIDNNSSLIGSALILPSTYFSWHHIGTLAGVAQRGTRDFIFEADDGVEIDQVVIARVQSNSISLAENTIKAVTADNINGFSVVPNEGIYANQNFSGQAEFKIAIAETGTYKILAKVSAPSTSENSVFLSAGELNQAIWHFPILNTGEFVWREYPILVHLNAGEQTILFNGREHNTGISELALHLLETGPREISTEPPSTANYSFSDIESLNFAIRNAKPGEQFVLQGGNYQDAVIEVPAYVSGTLSNPITIQGLSAGSTVITGNSKFLVYGQHVNISGFRLEGVGEKAVWLGGHHNRFDDSVVIDSGGAAYDSIIYIPKGSTNNVISNNEFSGSLSMTVKVDAPMFGRNEAMTRDNVIENNNFHDILDPGVNGREAIQVGHGNAGPYPDLRTLIQGNRFERANGDGEIISIKSNGNSIVDNLFLDSTGELVLRHSHNMLVSGNRLINTNFGIRVSGTNSRIVNNFFYQPNGGNALRLTDGCVNYYGAQNNVVANNTFISGGDSVRVLSWACDHGVLLPVEDNIFANNIFKIYSNSDRQIFKIDNVASEQSFITNNQFHTNIGDFSGEGPDSPLVPSSGVDITDIDVTVINYFPEISNGSDAHNSGTGGYVTDDIRGYVRDLQPDIGAWEVH